MLRELSEETGHAYSRRIVGWAYDRAVCDRRPSSGLVHHSDRGSSYTALLFGETLRAYGFLESVGRPATCYDNAAIKSFFATLKNEVIHRHGPYTREDLIRSLRACPRAMSVSGW